MDKLQKNPYFDKYADKIAKMQKSNPQEFLDKLNVLEDQGKAKGGKSDGKEGKFSLPTKPKQDVKPGAASMVTEKVRSFFFTFRNIIFDFYFFKSRNWGTE